MNPQLALGITLRDDASLATFTPGDNAQLLAALQGCARAQGEPFLYLWGSDGCGKTHLLQAACQCASQAGRSALYLPLNEAHALGPDILNDLESLDLVCIDDIDAIAGDQAWEEALFHLYNRLRANQTGLITTAGCSPLTLPLKLADLRSRLGWGVCYQINPLSDEQKRQLLINEAQRRGLMLNDDTAAYILRHTQRDVGSLKALIERLDHASLAAQRRQLTIPFVKTCLGL
ncbi:MAG: DnaA regulatory inactivator Hda [Sedimenticola sp.]|jgi:DnaA family protein|nr:MAG: DnaA regulatory inactivator Hda [Sedimenticola sp.]